MAFYLLGLVQWGICVTNVCCQHKEVSWKYRKIIFLYSYFSSNFELICAANVDQIHWFIVRWNIFLEMALINALINQLSPATHYFPTASV